MSISSRINEMSSHIEQAYDELQGLGADLTNVNKNIENISMVLDDIYDSMPQVSGEGTNLTLDDTRVGKIKSTLKGNTSQSGTPTPTSPIPVNVVSGDNSVVVCGKNLFDKTSNIIVDKYIGSDGTIQNEALNWYQDDYIKVSSSTTYYMSANSNTTIRAALYDESKNFISRIYSTGNLQVDTTATTKYVRLSGYNNLNNNIMLELSNAPTTYEAYTGETYLINLPEGIELCKIGNYQDYFGKSDGRNLFDKDKDIVEGYTFGNDNALITATDFFYQSYYIPVEPNTTYSFLGQKILGRDSLRVCEYTSDKTFIKRNYELYTITTTQNTHYIRVSNYKDKLNTTQVEKGSRATSWQPYGVGTWYKYGAIGYVMFDGSEDEDWIERSSTSADYWKVRYDGGLPTFITGRLDMITNYFVPNGGANDAGYSGNAICGNAGQYANWVHVSIDNTIANSVASFKTWLSTHNLKVYYVQATPTNTEITYQPLIDQLNLLEKAMSKDGQTNISQVNNDLPFIISASALKEWQENTSLNSTLSMVNPLSLGNTLNTQENDTQPIEVDNIEPLEEEENEES